MEYDEVSMELWRMENFRIGVWRCDVMNAPPLFTPAQVLVLLLVLLLVLRLRLRLVPSLKGKFKLESVYSVGHSGPKQGRSDPVDLTDTEFLPLIRFLLGRLHSKM